MKTYSGYKQQLNETFLTELFDRPYRWQTANLNGRSVSDAAKDIGEVNYTFTSGDGVPVVVTFVETGDGDEIEMAFTKRGKFVATGDGDAPRIFATVIDVAKDFMQQVPDGDITFSALKDTKDGNPSRSRLYTSMLKRYARRHNFDFSIKELGRETLYLIKR